MTPPILVPLDGSVLAEQALQPAAGLARRSDAELHLVRVHLLAIPVGYPEATVFFSAELEKRARDAEREYLNSIASRIPDVRVRTALLDGSIVNALEQYIASQDIGLIVMTTHGRGGLSRAWLGSIADALIRHARIPVLLRRPDSEPAEPARDGYSHILIPLDGSETAESVLEHAMRIGSLTNAHYTLVQIVPPPDDFVTAEAMASLMLPPNLMKQAEVESRAYLERVADRMRAEGCEVRTKLVGHRQPAGGILDTAAEVEADMIAIATHGRSGLRRVALGSVADKVLRSTNLPLLVYRPTKAARDRERSVA